MHDRLLSSLEVAEILGVSARTLDNWAYHRTGPPYAKVGTVRRYRRADVDAFVEANLVATNND